VEVKIGVKGAPREILLETDLTPNDVLDAVGGCLSEPGGLLDLSAARGRRVLVPADKLAYVEVGEQEARRVGFGAM
jgi:hypothetical protein